MQAFGVLFNVLYHISPAWQVDLSYTRYDGADRYNLINDRDFIGGFIKFSF